jgi:DNA-directed RNA polymerase specialized sigma24 family protein
VDAGVADPDPAQGPEDAALSNVWCNEVRQRLGPALQVLREEDRRLVILPAGERRPSYRTVSALTGRPIGSIGPTRQRALERLRRQPSIAALDRSA